MAVALVATVFGMAKQAEHDPRNPWLDSTLGGVTTWPLEVLAWASAAAAAVASCQMAVEAVSTCQTRWLDSRCGGLILSRSLTMFTRCEWVTYPPPWVTLRPFLLLAVLFLTYVLGYDF